MFLRIFFELLPAPEIPVRGLEKPMYLTGPKVVDAISKIEHPYVYVGPKKVLTQTTYISSGSFGRVFERAYILKNVEYRIAEKISTSSSERLTELELLQSTDQTSFDGVIYMKSLNDRSVLMPRAAGDLSDLYQRLDAPALDQVCQKLLFILNGLLKAKLFYFDLKAKNILYFIHRNNYMTVELGDGGGVVPNVGLFSATHTHKDLQIDGYVDVELFSDHYVLWFFYIYQVCLLYCRLLLGQESAVLPVCKSNNDTVKIVQVLCERVKLRAPACLRKCKYVTFLQAVCQDIKNRRSVDHKRRVKKFITQLHADLLE